jgi:prophage antirepressor-like protein
MNQVIKFKNLRDRIVELRGQMVLLDADVAELYGVETKRVNEAVKNNPEKFPAGYIEEFDDSEWESLKSKFSTSMNGKKGDEKGMVHLRSKISTAKFAKTRVPPKAFSEKGLYMLATILKSHKAVEATFAIIETFAHIRQLSRNIHDLSRVQDKSAQKALMQKSGELIAGIFDDDLKTSDSETSIELNFAVLKFRHIIKKRK